MAVTVKKAVLWRRNLDNRPGTLSEALKPYAAANVNLQVVMGYVFPDDRSKAALEVYPVQGSKAEQAGKAAGMAPATGIHCLVVSGPDQVGLAHSMAEALNKAGLNISFAMIQVVKKTFVGVFGFDSEAAANKAAPLLKAAGAGAKKAAVKKTARKAAKKKTTAKKKPAVRRAAAKKGATKAKARKKAAPAKKATKRPAKKGAAKKKPVARKKRK